MQLRGSATPTQAGGHDATRVPGPDRRIAMTTLSVRLSNSLHRQIRELAKREGISINQFLSTAAAEKLSALMTEEYLNERAERASREMFEEALAQLPDSEPEDQDRL